MADNTVFITSITGSFSGSAVHMNTSTPGNSSSPGRFSGLTVRDTGRHRNACVRIHMKVKMSSELVISHHAKTVNKPAVCLHQHRRCNKDKDNENDLLCKERGGILYSVRMTLRPACDDRYRRTYIT
ncbi:hypothetical protein RJ640_022030 [Escallonia rubra]|uniref:Uncharacterized protein n=1 Tax=Escallonia rubra TaxID=112253 RepID=A0AA88U6N3_9ASTE|nr:hypothetical protein RJ640_022030 [Escallonia rubra]